MRKYLNLLVFLVLFIITLLVSCNIAQMTPGPMGENDAKIVTKNQVSRAV